MTIYPTIQGDLWDSIAYKVYGKESYMTQLMQANPDYLDIVVFSAGVQLAVPEIATPSAANLPPWKRG